VLVQKQRRWVLLQELQRWGLLQGKQQQVWVSRRSSSSSRCRASYNETMGLNVIMFAEQ
jgi:hypothetical protein